MTMIVIGLVGRIAAGKSTVARMFAERGAVVIDADAVAHEVLDEPDVVREIVARFGPGVVDAAGRVRRGPLAEAVFGPDQASGRRLRALEGVVHPRVRRRIEAALAGLRDGPATGAGRVAVLDVPLLVQAGWGDLCDRLVVVECEESVRRGRLAARGWSEAEAVARDRAWERGYVPPAAGPKTMSVDASGDPAYTRSQVERILDRVRGAPPR